MACKLLMNNSGAILPPVEDSIISVDDYINHVNGIGFANVKVEKVDSNSFRYTGGGAYYPTNVIGVYSKEKSLKLIPNAKYSLKFTVPYTSVYIVSPTVDLKPMYNTNNYEYIFTCDSTGEIMTMVNRADTTLISSVTLTLLEEPPQVEWEDLIVETGMNYGKVTPITLFDSIVPSNDKLLMEIEATPYKTTTSVPSISFYGTNAHTTGKSIKTNLSLTKDVVCEFRIYHTSNYSIRADWREKGTETWGSGSTDMSSNSYAAFYRINDMKAMRVKKYI